MRPINRRLLLIIDSGPCRLETSHAPTGASLRVAKIGFSLLVSLLLKQGFSEQPEVLFEGGIRLDLEAIAVFQQQSSYLSFQIDNRSLYRRFRLHG